MSTQIACRYSHTVGVYANFGRGFGHPVDVGLGPDGLLYVVSRGGADVAARMAYKRVAICTVDEQHIRDFSHGGREDGQMLWPVSIALDRDGNVYISDEALHRISIFDKDGKFLTKWGVQGKGDGQFDRPAGIAFDADDNLLVADGLNNRVQRYTRDGRFLGSWGQRGTGPGEFDNPWGICVDREANLYVADWRNDRIQKFHSDGHHQATFGKSGQSDGEFDRPSGVAVDRRGNIYVADWRNERVQVLGPDGTFITKLRGESGVSKWGQEYFISNQDELEERNKADLEPPLDLQPVDYLRNESASIEKFFWGPISVKVDDEDRLFVVDSCRHRIQVYHTDG